MGNQVTKLGEWGWNEGNMGNRNVGKQNGNVQNAGNEGGNVRTGVAMQRIRLELHGKLG